MRVHIFTTDNIPADDERCRRVAKAFMDAGFQITDADDAQFIVSLGGDGTFLRAAHKFGASGNPLLGINAGRLGFITAAAIDNVSDIALAMAKGEYRIERRSMLAASFSSDGNESDMFALNEMAVLKRDSASMISSTVKLNHRELANYVGDGLIVSTPTGSTGYNLSVGGPILEPTAPIFVISPIAAHSLSLRPLVVSDRSVIDITTKSRSGSYLLSIDGHSITMPSGSEVTIYVAPHLLNVVHLHDQHFANVLRNKLLWGVDNR